MASSLSSSAGSKQQLTAALARLGALKSSGALSAEEFRQAKASLLTKAGLGKQVEAAQQAAAREEEAKREAAERREAAVLALRQTETQEEFGKEHAAVMEANQALQRWCSTFDVITVGRCEHCTLTPHFASFAAQARAARDGVLTVTEGLRAAHEERLALEATIRELQQMALEQDRIVRKEQKRRARAVQEYRAARAESAAAQEQAAQLRAAADADRQKLEAGGRREVELRSSLAATEVAAAQERQRHEQQVLELETQLDLCTQDSERLAAIVAAAEAKAEAELQAMTAPKALERGRGMVSDVDSDEDEGEDDDDVDEGPISFA